MEKREMESLFLLAGFNVVRAWELPNGYDPVSRPDSHWWLVRTEQAPGLIKIGWRKRVINIDWEDTGVEIEELTKDEVTKDKTGVHAWGNAKAVEYLTALRLALRRAAHEKTVKEEV